jgi:hypothetical protein
MSGSRFKLGAVLVGLFVEVGCVALMSYLVGFAFGVLFGVSTGTQREMMSVLGASDAVHWSLVVIMTVGTFLGGYVAGRVAGTWPIEHGGLVGLCTLGAAGFLYFQGYHPGFEIPQWAMLLGAFFALPAGAAGGFVASDSPGAFV